MSEHTWVLENLAGYVAGGLDADEREQLEEHLSECADCARALAQVRAADRKLEGLFAAIRPNPALEDRSIQMLRQLPRRAGGIRFSTRGKVLAAVAAAILLAVTGGGVSALLEEENVAFARGVSQNQLKQMGLSLHTYAGAVRGEKAQEGRDYGWHEGFGDKDGEALAQEFRETSRQHAAITNGSVDNLDESKKSAGRDHYRQQADQRAFGMDFGFKTAPADGTSNSVTFSPDGKLRTRSESGGRSNDYSPPRGFQVPRRVDQKDGDAKAKPPAVYSDGMTPKAETERAGRVPKEAGTLPIHLPSAPEPQEKPPEKTAPPKAAPAGRKIIRSGEIDFEVTSFDDAVAVVTRLVNATKGGFVATINSDKLPNGKVRGSVVVRVPPDQLDRLILDLRKEITKAGELKSQRIGSQDITKQYTDLESRLRAARTMEERLLKIIRDGKGEIKDLVAAEKELGVWRTRVEEIEGELRYYNNMVSLSTLTVNLTEKSISSAAAIDERERVQAGIEVEDVDLALREALKTVTEARGRITKSELKQQSAGRFSAVLNFEVDPDQAGPVRDRLRQLGNMVRLEIDRVQTAEGGGTAPKDGKVRRGPTQFFVSLYNLANVSPRETQTLKLAASDVPAAFRTLREAVGKVKGHVVNAQLNEQDKQNVTAQLDFDVRRVDEGAVQNALGGAGEVLSRHVGRAAEGENVSDAKVLFKVELIPITAITPREVTTLTLEVADVEAAVTLLNAQVKEVEGRTVDEKGGQERNGRTTARVIVDVPLGAKPGLVEKLKSAGVVRGQFVTRNPQAPGGKLAVARLDVTLSNDILVPRDEGLWSQIRNGLSFSLRGLSLSVSWLIVGVLFLLPWAILVYAVVWLFRRLWRSEPAPAVATAAPAGRGATPETGT
jgi:hypothetical protein